MPDTTHSESSAVTEMKLIHDIHRAATALLTEAAERPAAPPAQLAELRDFVVAALRHHHESEDTMLWPMLQTTAPRVAAEIAPHRVNAVHPGLIGDSPKWRDVRDHPHIVATPIGRLVTMEEVAEATDFLLRNTGMNAHELYIDGGFLIR